MSKIKMLNNNVLITLEDVSNVTSSGIILDSSSNKSFRTAKIASVPEGQDVVNVGDTIYISLYAGTELVMDGIAYSIINIKDIILIV